MKRRVIAVAVVVGAFSLAAAVTGPHVTVGPPNIAVQSVAGSSSVLTAHNDGDQGVAVSGIGVDASCAMTDGAGMTANFVNFPTNTFSFAVGDSQPISMMCPLTGPSASQHGIRRCKWFVKKDDSPMGRLADFSEICLYQSTNGLIANPLDLNFGNINVGSMGSASFMLTSNVATTGVYYSIVDGDENYTMSTPCSGGPHCHDTSALAANTPRQVVVTCTPKRSGNLDTDLHVVTDNGNALFTQPVRLHCNGNATGGDVNLSQVIVTRSTPVLGGVVTANVTLQNASPTQPLVINSMLKTGSTDWGMTISSPCDSIPCTLPPTQMVNITFTFDPSMIGDVDGLVTINSNDPQGAATITLDGTGEGTTLSLVTPGAPPFAIGATPIGTPIARTFTVRNQPATQGLPVSIAVTNTPTFDVDIDTATIAMAGTQDIVVTCMPPTAGTHQATFTVTGMATFGDPIEVAMTCIGTTGNLSYAPSMFALGDVRIDGAGPRVVGTVQLNTNGPMLAITSGPSETSPQVSLGPVSSQMIVMGTGSTFDVSFDPGGTEGPVSTNIVVAAGAETATIPFSANVVKAQLAEPAPASFGSYCIGKPIPPQTLKLVSTGTATIHMAQRPDLELMAASPFALTLVSPTSYPTDLATNAEATIRIEPRSSLAPGMYSDHVSWMTDATSPRTPVTLELLADGGGIAPGAVDFGPVEVKQSAAPQTVLVQNCDAGVLTLAPPVFDPPGEFRAISELPMSLAPGESVALELAFSPAGNGVRTSKLTIAASSGDLAVDLNGTGLGDGSGPRAPASLYACSCATGDPVGGCVILLALVVPLIPRRRRR